VNRKRFHCVATALAFATATACARDVSVDFYDHTPNCREAIAQAHRVCVEASEQIVPGSPRYHITTVNGNSRVVSLTTDEGGACVTASVRVAPVGEDCYAFGICNCRGTGWLGIRVTLQTTDREGGAVSASTPSKAVEKRVTQREKQQSSLRRADNIGAQP
jgi:hypothetical protein